MRRRLILGVACSLIGCTTSRFVRLDEAFEPQPKMNLPEVLVGVEVPADFRTVGVIEILHTNVTEPDSILASARREGRNLGCELVVQPFPDGNKNVHSQGVEVVIGAGLGPSQPEMENRSQFLCAVAERVHPI